MWEKHVHFRTISQATGAGVNGRIARPESTLRAQARPLFPAASISATTFGTYADRLPLAMAFAKKAKSIDMG